MLGVLLVLTVIFHLQIVLASEFPISEFFQTAYPNNSIASDIDFESLQEIYLCRGFSKCCECKPQCIKKRTCCIDYLWDSSNPLPINEYMAKFKNEMNRQLAAKCMLVEPFSSLPNYRKNKGFYMVNSCSNSETRNANLCINDHLLADTERLPVYGKDRNVYKNRYCALCNNIESYVPVNLTLECKYRLPTAPTEINPPTPGVPMSVTRPPLPQVVNSTTPRVTEPPPPTTTPAPAKLQLDAFTQCTAIIQYSTFLPSSDAPVCYPDKVFNEESCQNPEYEFCHLYKGVFGDHKNIHCHACRGKAYTSSASKGCFDVGPGPDFAWSITITFASERTQITVRKLFTSGYKEDYTVCGPGQVLNAITNNCEAFSCAPGFIVSGTRCLKEIDKTVQPFVTHSNFSRYLTWQNASVYFVLIENASFAIENFTKLYESDFNTTNERFLFIYSNSATILRNTRTLNQDEFEKFEAKLFADLSSLSTFQYAEEIVISSNRINEVTKLYGFDLSRHFSNGKVCAQPKEIVNISNFLESNNVSFADLTFYQTVIRNNVSQKLFYCQKYHLMKDCPLNNLNSSHYSLNATTMDVVVFSKDGNISLKPTDYLPKTKGIAVCRNYTGRYVQYQTSGKVYHWEDDFKDVQTYFGLVLSIISAICGICFIIANVFLKELRNRGGRIILALAISVLVSDILYIMANFSGDYGTLCKAVGILLHFFLLVVSIWALILVFDLVFQIVIKQVHKQKSKDKRDLITYCLISIIPPFAIVTVCVILDETDIISFGYGNNGVCWITSYYPSLVAYLIPAALGYAISFICCVIFLRHLNQETSALKSALKGSVHADIDMLAISTKVIVVLGIAEVLGFVQIEKDSLSEDEVIVNATFAFIFNVMRSLRGTLIFFFYLVNRKTYMLFKAWKQRNEDRTISNITLSTMVPSCPTTPIVLPKK